MEKSFKKLFSFPAAGSDPEKPPYSAWSISMFIKRTAPLTSSNPERSMVNLPSETVVPPKNCQLTSDFVTAIVETPIDSDTTSSV